MQKANEHEGVLPPEVLTDARTVAELTTDVVAAGGALPYPGTRAEATAASSTVPEALTTSTPAELTIYDHQQRYGTIISLLHLGTVIAVVCALLGATPMLCAVIPSAVLCIPALLWARRDLRALRAREQQKGSTK